MTCKFCPETKTVNEKGICDQCRRLSKTCRKGTGIFYNVKTKSYVDGDSLIESSPCIIFDLHGVADLFTVDEFSNLIKPILNRKVYILSYVGSTTNTRLEACEWLEKLLQISPNVKPYLCFYRKNVMATGNKGGFISMLSCPNVIFLDDSEDHFMSAASLSTAYLVPEEGGKVFVEEIVKELY